MGYLAVRYGEQAMPYLAAHKWQAALAVVALVAVSYGLSRLLLKNKPQDSAQS
jgi:hypothetical protein